MCALFALHENASNHKICCITLLLDIIEPNNENIWRRYCVSTMLDVISLCTITTSLLLRNNARWKRKHRCWIDWMMMYIYCLASKKRIQKPVNSMTSTTVCCECCEEKFFYYFHEHITFSSSCLPCENNIVMRHFRWTSIFDVFLLTS